MDLEATIRSLPNTGEVMAEPRSIRVSHHRSGQAEINVEVMSGGHMLHLALAACVFNNVNRIARERGIRLTDSKVSAGGRFNEEGTNSTGISCRLSVSGEADEKTLEGIAREAFEDSSVAAVLGHATTIELAGIEAHSVPAPG
jgi:uncharacterized OsmC-like protein